jgi:hypothetical protein
MNGVYEPFETPEDREKAKKATKRAARLKRYIIKTGNKRDEKAEKERGMKK